MSDEYFDLQQSYGRCLRHKQFIERFYEIFMASSPRVTEMFAKTDFQKQRLALRRGISVAIFHAAGSGVVKRTIDQMADVHACRGRAPVPPELYPFWVESLIKVVEEFDPEVGPRLLDRWREGMASVVETFTQRYPGH